MDFFRFILTDDQDPPASEKHPVSGSGSPTKSPQHRQDNDDDGADGDDPLAIESNSDVDHNPTERSDGGGWIFGGLFKTLATRSESVIEAYRRDLQEFGSGLRRETDLLREVASKAVKDLPASIEVGAAVAHGSMETVGHAIDGVLKSTAEIISQGKETLVQSSDNESDTPDAIRNLDLRRYNRFDAQLRTAQADVNTYCDEPEDADDYINWKQGFILEEKTEEVESLIGENGVMGDIYKRLVPSTVDRDTFWCRYFYRVHKLEQQEKLRANLVKRAAITADDEEELSWDMDDEDDESNKMAGNGNAIEDKESGNKPLPQMVEEERSEPKPKYESAEPKWHAESSTVVDQKEESKSSDRHNVGVSQETIEANSDESSVVKKSDESVLKADKEEKSVDKKFDHGESSTNINVNQQMSLPEEEEEEELGWDEIEDLGSDDVKKVTETGRSTEADLRKRLSALGEVDDEEEDLSWDIEEDDEDKPMKT